MAHTDPSAGKRLAGAAAPRFAAAAILIAGAGLCLWLNWPGHFSWDSVMQLGEGRSGGYSGQHPPVMSWLLGAMDRIVHGGALFVIFDVALVFGALAALVCAGGRGAWLAVALAAVALTLPQLVIYPAIVWKDVLFAGASTAAFAGLAWAARLWPRRRLRWGLIALALLLVALATLTRQNGVLALPFAAGALGWLAMTGGGLRRGAAYGLGFLAAGAVVMLAASAALATHLEDRRATASQWEHLQLYDLVAAVAREPAIPLPVLHAKAPWLEALLRGDGADAYEPSRVDPLTDALFEPMEQHGGDVSGAVADEWRGLILGHPLLYLRIRASAFSWVLLTREPEECVLVQVGVDADPEMLPAAGLTERRTDRDNQIEAYVERLGGTPVFWHAAYGLVAIGLMALLLRRRRAADIPVAAMLGAALAFAASFAAISLACDYRYLYDLDLAAIAAALYAAASWPAPSLLGGPLFRRAKLRQGEGDAAATDPE